MTKVFRFLAIFIVSFFIIPVSFFEVYVSSVACGSFEGILLFCKQFIFMQTEQRTTFNRKMYTHSSKHINNWFTILIQREIQIQSLGLGSKCASQFCCSQEWAKYRHGHKHPNNLTFEFEVCYFNFRYVSIWILMCFRMKWTAGWKTL